MANKVGENPEESMMPLKPSEGNVLFGECDPLG